MAPSGNSEQDLSLTSTWSHSVLSDDDFRPVSRRDSIMEAVKTVLSPKSSRRLSIPRRNSRRDSVSTIDKSTIRLRPDSMTQDSSQAKDYEAQDFMLPRVPAPIPKEVKRIWLFDREVCPDMNVSPTWSPDIRRSRQFEGPSPSRPASRSTAAHSEYEGGEPRSNGCSLPPSPPAHSRQSHPWLAHPEQSAEPPMIRPAATFPETTRRSRSRLSASSENPSRLSNGRVAYRAGYEPDYELRYCVPEEFEQIGYADQSSHPYSAAPHRENVQRRFTSATESSEMRLPSATFRESRAQSKFRAQLADSQRRSSTQGRLSRLSRQSERMSTASRGERSERW